MSQADVLPDETLPEVTEPVEAQVVSPGEPKATIEVPTSNDTKVEVPQGEWTDIVKDEVDEAAVLKKQQEAAEEFDRQVAEAVKHQFDVQEVWQPRMITKFIIDCPSGQKVLVKHLDTMALMRSDLIEELDFFTKRLFPASYDDQGNPIEPENGPRQDIWATLRDPKKRARFLSMTGRLMSVAAVKPEIIYDGVALKKDERTGQEVDVFGYEVDDIEEQIKLFGKPVPKLKVGEAYAGTIDFADRMAFLTELNKPLGMIEPFREGSNVVLASMEPVESPGVPSERPV